MLIMSPGDGAQDEAAVARRPGGRSPRGAPGPGVLRAVGSGAAGDPRAPGRSAPPRVRAGRAVRHLDAGGLAARAGPGAGWPGAAGAHGPRRALRARGRADVRGRRVDQRVQPVLAGAVRHAGGVGQDARPPAREAAHELAPGAGPALGPATGAARTGREDEEPSMKYREGTRRLVAYRKRIAALRDKMRAVQRRIEP